MIIRGNSRQAVFAENEDYFAYRSWLREARRFVRHEDRVCEERSTEKAIKGTDPFVGPLCCSNKPFARSSKVGRVAGRWLPFIGWGLLGKDAFDVGKCMKNCEKNKQCSAK